MGARGWGREKEQGRRKKHGGQCGVHGSTCCAPWRWWEGPRAVGKLGGRMAGSSSTTALSRQQLHMALLFDLRHRNAGLVQRESAVLDWCGRRIEPVFCFASFLLFLSLFCVHLSARLCSLASALSKARLGTRSRSALRCTLILSHQKQRRNKKQLRSAFLFSCHVFIARRFVRDAAAAAATAAATQAQSGCREESDGGGHRDGAQWGAGESQPVASGISLCHCVPIASVLPAARRFRQAADARGALIGAIGRLHMRSSQRRSLVLAIRPPLRRS